MAYKFEIVNNALQVTNTVSTAVLIYLPARDAWFSEEDLDSSDVSIYGISGHDTFKDLPLDECTDENDVTFTKSTFRLWCSNNLGFRIGGGG